MARTRLRGLRIGGIQIGIEVPADYPWQWPDAPIADFACPARDPEVHVGVRLGAVTQVDLEGERYPVSTWTFEVKRYGEDWLLGLSLSGRREILARFDAEFRSGEVVVSRESLHAMALPLRPPLAEWIVVHRTLLHGGLCLSGTARAVADRASIRLGDGTASPADAVGWSRIPSSSARVLRPTVLMREEAGRLCAYRTPWSDGFDPQLLDVTPVGDVIAFSRAARTYREQLDPDEAADLLVTHAVVPLSDEVLLDRVLRNARRMAERIRVLRVGGEMGAAAGTDWRSAPLQCAFGPPQSWG